MKIEYEPIGFVSSPYKNIKEIPNQSHYAKDITGQVYTDYTRTWKVIKENQ